MELVAGGLVEVVEVVDVVELAGGGLAEVVGVVEVVELPGGGLVEVVDVVGAAELVGGGLAEVVGVAGGCRNGCCGARHRHTCLTYIFCSVHIQLPVKTPGEGTAS